MESNKLYLNGPQLECALISAHTEWIIGGRGVGKTEGFVAPRVYRNIFEMPRSNGAFVVPTYKSGLTQTLPGIFHGLENFGLKRNIHYVFGRKAPKELNFASPHIEPFTWEHCFHFFNGTVAHLISQDRIGTSNSRNLDWIVLDETKLLKYDRLINETFQANRGNKRYYSDCPHHHGIIATTDQPTAKVGQWIWDKEKDMDHELLLIIKDRIARINEFKAKKQTKNTIEKIRSYDIELSKWRKHLTLFKEFSTIENVAVLGEDFIKQMKRDLPPLIFQTSILNKRVRKVANGFYSAYNPKLHTYDSFDYGYIDNLTRSTLDLDISKMDRTTCLFDSDIDRDKPLYIAFDYNGSINWITIGQIHGNVLRVINSMFVKGEQKLPELVKNVCNYYSSLSRKEVVYYYDHTAMQGSYATSNRHFYQDVISLLNKNKWKVTAKYIGQAARHSEKHRQLDFAFKGQKGLFPMFNRNNNEALLLAIEQTGISIGSKGFGKDKSGEKLEETPNNQLQYRTDATDSFDTLWLGCNNYPVQSIQLVSRTISYSS